MVACIFLVSIVTACSSADSSKAIPSSVLTESASPGEEGETTTSTSTSAPTTTDGADSNELVTSTSSTSSTIPGPRDSYQAPTIDGAALERCKLLDQSPDTRHPIHLSTGFPVQTSNFPAAGSIKVALIAVEFDDFAGRAADIDDAIHHTKLVTDWYSMVSDGRVIIDWQIHDTVIHVPQNLQEFALERSRSDDDRLARVAFEAADPFVDFTDVRAAIFLLPRRQMWMAEGVQGFLHSAFGYEGGYASEEGAVFNYSIGGAYWEEPNREIWTYWAHEMGHMFALPDLYDVRGQWWNGVDLEIPGGPFSQFDMMANQDGPSRTLSTWLRFMMGWLDESQVLCVDPEDPMIGDVSLVHTDSEENGIKSVMVPLDETRILVIESRRPNEKFDCPSSLSESPGWRVRTGVLVYTADMTIGHGNGFQHLVVPDDRTLHDAPRCGVPPQLDAILTPGDTVAVDNVTVTINEVGNYDHVSITIN